MPGSLPDSAVHTHFKYTTTDRLKKPIAECLLCHEYRKTRNTSRQKQHLLEECPEYHNFIKSKDRPEPKRNSRQSRASFCLEWTQFERLESTRRLPRQSMSLANHSHSSKIKNGLKSGKNLDILLQLDRHCLGLFLIRLIARLRKMLNLC